MTWRRSAAVLAVLMAATAGCAHKSRPNTYRLLQAVRGPVLVPPGVADPDLTRRTVAFDIAAARGDCLLEQGVVGLQRRKNGIRATVNRVLLEQQPPGWLADWSIRVESNGCIPPGSGEKLARMIAESVPLNSAAASRLLQPSFRRGYVELGPEHRLEVRSPILLDGAPPESGDFEVSSVSGSGARMDVNLTAAPGIVGYEIAWYGIRRNEGRVGYHLVPLFADRNIRGVTERMPEPSRNYFQFPPQAAYFRLLYKTEDNGVRAIVVCGATKAELERQTRAVESGLAACQKPAGMCIVLPRRVGVNPFMAVSVNGVLVTVPLGATVSQAIQAAGATDPAAVLAGLRVTRPFGARSAPVEFERDSREILGLPLLGGEEILWH